MKDNLYSLVASGRASLEDMAQLGVDAVREIKTSRDVQQMRVRAAEPIAKNEETRTISYLVSDETPDRMGDIIRVRGWDLQNYKRNPVVLWGHNANMPPIGKATNVRRRYGPARLTADIEFAPKEAYEFADTVYQLAARGFLKATSVGFMPRAVEDVDEKKRARLGLGPYGQLYSEAELMEISVVAVPANPSALEDGVKQLVGEGLLEKSMAPRFLESYPGNAKSVEDGIRRKIRSFIDLGAFKSAAPKAAPDALKVGDFVRWESSGGTARGKIERIERDGVIDVPDSSFKVTGTPDDPAALIQIYRDEDPTETRVAHKFSTLTKINRSAPVEQQEAESVEKSPACRVSDETEAECVTRKVPELIEEGMEQDQAVAVASELCAESCDKSAAELKHVARVTETDEAVVVSFAKLEMGEGASEAAVPADAGEAKLVDALAYLIEQQAEQTRATRQLVDGLTDLTKALHLTKRDEARSGTAPEAPASEVAQKEVASEEVLDAVFRGFAERFGREILKP